MLEHLTDEIRDGLGLARQRKARRSRLRVQFGDAFYPVLGLTESTLVFAADNLPRLRGCVDVFDGARHILQGLVIAAQAEGGVITCAFKRRNVVSETPPADYLRDPDAPAGLLPRH
jgi:hypothetical protein